MITTCIQPDTNEFLCLMTIKNSRLVGLYYMIFWVTSWPEKFRFTFYWTQSALRNYSITRYFTERNLLYVMCLLHTSFYSTHFILRSFFHEHTCFLWTRSNLQLFTRRLLYIVSQTLPENTPYKHHRSRAAVTNMQHSVHIPTVRTDSSNNASKRNMLMMKVHSYIFYIEMTGCVI